MVEDRGILSAMEMLFLAPGSSSQGASA